MKYSKFLRYCIKGFREKKIEPKVKDLVDLTTAHPKALTPPPPYHLVPEEGPNPDGLYPYGY